MWVSGFWSIWIEGVRLQLLKIIGYNYFKNYCKDKLCNPYRPQCLFIKEKI